MLGHRWVKRGESCHLGFLMTLITDIVEFCECREYRGFLQIIDFVSFHLITAKHYTRGF